ncbi:MAG: hypothetical protein NTV06_01925 [candidate division Zixibacteria bacterium]|nr:hypothetical protein [candidate division Zixibacteria bacterium]
MTGEIDKSDQEAKKDWFIEIDELASQVKTLALNLAIGLAQAKNEMSELTYLEPEFTKLINGSVDVIREVMAILKTFRNEDKMVYSPPSNSDKLDRIEVALNEILSLSQGVLKTIADIKNKNRKVDNYR